MSYNSLIKEDICNSTTVFLIKHNIFSDLMHIVFICELVVTQGCY